MEEQPQQSDMISRDNIVVMVRIRPQNQTEINHKICIRLNQEHKNSVFLETRPIEKMFTFDHVADENTTQQEIFKTIC